MSLSSAETITFLYTDIEGSTRLWEQQPEAMQTAVARHNTIIRQAIESNGGRVFRTAGDAFCASFVTAPAALAAALSAQQALHAETWGLANPLRIRVVLHTCQAEEQDGDYVGSGLNRVGRLLSVCYGGQTLLSLATEELVRDHLPAQVSLLDLGQHRFRDLVRPEHVYQLVHPLLPSEFPPIKSLDTLPNNLPVQLTSFIGRQNEISEVISLLNSARLVTVTGSGGTGKTRLAQEVSAQELTSFPQGVWLIELALLTDPSQIIPAIAQVFGLQELPYNPLATMVIDYLRDKKALLILDNCEHLIGACARLADDLLHQCAGLKIIASSREALGIAGEVAYRIPSLVDSESTQLFVERARLSNPKFNMTDSNASSITQVCSRLDGIPLAIELAAARTRLLTPEQIAARLDDRFRLLVGGSRTALPRQQTLRALIDWSYDLLSDEEKRLLQYASVFVGGWTLDALEAVANDPNTFENLEQLVNKSLVVTEERQNEMRYFMLETVRQYAREKLFEAQQSSTARDRHFVYFDDLSEVMWDAFRALNEFALRDKAYDEFENMRAALDWGMEHQPEAALHLAANFTIVSSWTGNQIEGLSFLKLALERFRALPPVEGVTYLNRQVLLAKALFAQGMVVIITGGVQFARQSLQEAISIARPTGDKRILGYSLEMYYIASAFTNVLSEPDAVKEGLVLLSEIDDRLGLTMAYMNMARLAAARGDIEESQKYFGMLKMNLKESPISYQAGLTFFGMGSDERYRGHPDIAKQHFEEGLKIFIHLRHKSFENILRSEIGHISRITGDFNQAKKIYQETISRFQDLGNRSAVAHQLECFAFIAIAEEEPPRAAKLFGAAEALRERINSQMAKQEQVEYDQSVDQLRSMLPEAKFNAYWAEGRLMTMEQAISYAMEKTTSPENAV